jgi:general secretion pathway protein G
MNKKIASKLYKHNKKAFTLMELMVVIIILGLLASFVLPSLTSKSDEAKVKITCIEMKNIAQAVKMYKIDNASYPSTSEGLNILIEKKYFEDGKLPKDSWGNSFIYTQGGDGFELTSFGGDKQEGGSDDIYYSKCQEQQK